MLPLLLNLPKTPEDWLRFSYHHRTSHELIRTTIQAKSNIDLPNYVIDPIPHDQPKEWLQANQLYHSDMNSALKLPGVDLEDLDVNSERELQSWIYLHFLEHQSAEQRLGIAS